MSGQRQNGGSGEGSAGPPQLHMWDADAEEVELGTLRDSDGTWDLYVLVERAGRDLVRGRISFRRGELRHDTAEVIVEEQEQAVVERARDLSDRILRQFLASLRD